MTGDGAPFAFDPFDEATDCGAMNDSTNCCATSSGYWTGGDFMKYADGPMSGPETPRSMASFPHRTASMTTSGRSDAEMVTRPEKFFSRSVPPGCSGMVRLTCSVSSKSRGRARYFV